ncbi:hypothetical protein [Silvimonas soli]|uniref:hypothetical protein n=1 Tax=Silvimonas soli TaxID=2980100 RepID=UPI0024B3BB62|nr:hypothetical protein [Silvimonas soli]
MSENRHKLLDMELEHQRMTIKLFKIAGWTGIIVGIPLLIIPPIGLGAITCGLVARYMGKRFDKMATLVDAINREQLPPCQTPLGNT